MGRFVSHWINNVDKKGRVSIPASFRVELGAVSEFYMLDSMRHPAMEAFGEAMLDNYEARLGSFDLLSEDRDDLESHYFGSLLTVKFDGEGRIQLNERIRAKTRIADQVVFEGRNQFFRLWEPQSFAEFRQDVERRLPDILRRQQSSSGAPAAPTREQGT